MGIKSMGAYIVFKYIDGCARIGAVTRDLVALSELHCAFVKGLKSGRRTVKTGLRAKNHASDYHAHE